MPSYKADKKAANIPAATVDINNATKIIPPPPPTPPVGMETDTPGNTGSHVLVKYLAKHVRYPAIDHDKRIGGRVIAAFDVVDGKITNPEIVRSIEPVMDGELLRAIKAYNGKLDLKNGRYSIPLSFELIDSKNNKVSHLPEGVTANKPVNQSNGFSTSVGLDEVVVVGMVND